MTKLKRKRTEKKGWKPTDSSFPAGIRVADVDRMARKIQEILANDYYPNESESALLKQVCLLCRRVIAYKSGDRELNHLNNELTAHGKELHRNGFNNDKDIIPLNLWITRRVALEYNGPEDLLKQAEDKK